MKRVADFLKKWWQLAIFFLIAYLFGSKMALVSHMKISMVLIAIIGIVGAIALKLPDER